jgi:hypothetical protein
MQQLFQTAHLFKENRSTAEALLNTVAETLDCFNSVKCRRASFSVAVAGLLRSRRFANFVKALKYDF